MCILLFGMMCVVVVIVADREKNAAAVGWSPIVGGKRDSLLLLLQIIEKQFLSRRVYFLSYPGSILENNNAVPSAKFLLCARADHFTMIRGKCAAGKC